MKRLAIIAVIFMTVGTIVGYIFMQPVEADTQTDNIETDSPQPSLMIERETVSAEAFVKPEHEIQLAFETNGQLIELLVVENELVQAGQLLARLENSDQRLAVAEAEARLAIAEARLADALARATEAEIAQKEVAVAKAEAALSTALAGATPEEKAEARANLAVSQAQLAQKQAGTRSEELLAAEARVEEKEFAVQAALYQYNEVVGDNNEEAIETMGIFLQKATLNHELAKANYRTRLQGSTEEEIAVRQAYVGEAQAAYNSTVAGPTDEKLAVLMANIHASQAKLDELLAGTREERIAVRRAEVEQAEARLEQARLSLADTEIVAPFEGMITDLPAEVGQQVFLGDVILTLSTLSPWYIETDDLTELDVVHIKEGQTVNISVDALPAETFEGVVTTIKPKSETKAGDVTYEVRIDFTDDGATDSRLKWGMTTFVDIFVK